MKAGHAHRIPLTARAVEILNAASPSVRVNITLPEAVLKRIDIYAASHGMTRSGFLVKAAQKDMETAS